MVMVSPRLMPSFATSSGRARRHPRERDWLSPVLPRPRPLEIRRVPALGQLDDGVEVTFRGVHQRGMAGEKAEVAAAAPFDFESPVFGNGFHGEADFVHVRDDQDARRF